MVKLIKDARQQQCEGRQGEREGLTKGARARETKGDGQVFRIPGKPEEELRMMVPSGSTTTATRTNKLTMCRRRFVTARLTSSCRRRQDGSFVVHGSKIGVLKHTENNHLDVSTELDV